MVLAINKILVEIVIPKQFEGDISDSAKASQALLKLLLDAKKLKLSERDFSNQTRSQTDLSDEVIQLLWSYLSNDSSLEKLLSTDEFRFRDLEWRLEAKVSCGSEAKKEIFWNSTSSSLPLMTSLTFSFFQVASRFLHSQPPNPKVLMKIHLDREKSLHHRIMLSAVDDSEPTTKTLVMQSSPSNLAHIIDQLENIKNSVNVKRATPAQ